MGRLQSLSRTHTLAEISRRIFITTQTSPHFHARLSRHNREFFFGFAPDSFLPAVGYDDFRRHYAYRSSFDDLCGRRRGIHRRSRLGCRFARSAFKRNQNVANQGRHFKENAAAGPNRNSFPILKSISRGAHPFNALKKHCSFFFP